MTGEKGTPIVLVVDDEALIRWSLSEGLSDSGYRVRVAGSAAETREALTVLRHDPVVMVLDLRLPDVADLSLLHEIRSSRPDVPVIIMTAHGTADDQRRALAMGAFRFVTKPFDVAEIVALVADAVEAAHPTSNS